MKQHLLIGGAIALAFAAAAPVDAKPGKGNKNHGAYSQDYRYSNSGYQAVGCPPGLAKKNNGCLPPGQAKKLRIGQRYAQSYGYDPYAYNQIPYDVRQQYDLDPYNRYYYDDGSLYGVDPRTGIVEQIISALLR